MFELIKKAKLMKHYQKQLEADLRLAEFHQQYQFEKAEQNKNVPLTVLIEAAAILWRNERLKGEL